MLKYSSPTHRTVHYSTYPEGTTIGDFINMILRLKMHHFLFLPYPVEGRWKGCGDHTYVLSICCGDDIDMTWQSPLLGWLVGSDGANQSRSEIRADDFFLPAKIHENIGRGWWVSYNPPEDDLIQETTFSDRRPMYLLPKPQTMGPTKRKPKLTTKLRESVPVSRTYPVSAVSSGLSPDSHESNLIVSNIHLRSPFE